MVAQSRTLKLSILADVDQLKKSLSTANNDVENSSSKLGDFSKKAGVAFAAAAAAAGAYATVLIVDGVKAAIEDEAAQIRLATALKNATGATDAMIESVEKQITKTSLATGVADDKLRPALQRLTFSTEDVTKSQELLNLALDISQSTGKDLDAVANALGKAYDGNTTSLVKLGIGIDSAEAKTMNFETAQKKLTDLFGGAAAANAETYQGRIARIKIAFDEAKETIGAAFLPILGKLLDYVNNKALPIIDALSGAFSSKNGSGFGKVVSDVVDVLKDIFIPIFEAAQEHFNKFKKVINDNKENLKDFLDVVKFVAPLIGKIIGGAISVLGDIANVVINIFAKVLGAIKPMINFAIDGINLIIKGYNAIPFLDNIDLLPKITSSTTQGTSISGVLGSVTPIVSNAGTTVSGSTGGITGGATTGVTGTTGGGVGSAVAGAAAAAAKMTGAGGITDSQNAARLIAAGGAFTDSQNAARINLTVNGAIDAEGTARTIVNVLNDSFFRGTGGAGALLGASG